LVLSLGNIAEELCCLARRISHSSKAYSSSKNLSLTTPIAGVGTDGGEPLHMGEWINKEQALAYDIDSIGEEPCVSTPETAVGYLYTGPPYSPGCRSADLRRVGGPDSRHRRKQLHGALPPLRLWWRRIGSRGCRSSIETGTSVYRVTLDLVESPPQSKQAVRGTVLVEGPGISFAQRVWEQSPSIFIRESGAKGIRVGLGPQHWTPSKVSDQITLPRAAFCGLWTPHFTRYSLALPASYKDEFPI
jgi:hypothetical protein